jgi:hypothetical protein
VFFLFAHGAMISFLLTDQLTFDKVDNMQKMIQTKQTLQFWCNDCDSALVISDKPETGTFYEQFGHQCMYGQGDIVGDWHSVIFALCPNCDKK